MNAYPTAKIYLALTLTAFAMIAFGMRGDSTPPKAAESFLSPPLASFQPHMRHLLTGTHSGLYDDWMSFYLAQLVSRPASSNVDENALIRKALISITNQESRLASSYSIACYHLAFELETPADCRGISDIGMRVLPRDFNLLLMRGFMEKLMLESEVAARTYFTRAAQIPGAPQVANDMLALSSEADFWQGKAFSSAIAWLDQSPGGDAFKEYLQERRFEWNTPSQDETSIMETGLGNEDVNKNE